MTGIAGMVLFPGSGSSSQHSSLLAIENVMQPIPVARVDFPYRKAGKSFPDKAPVLIQCVKVEVRAFVHPGNHGAADALIKDFAALPAPSTWPSAASGP